MLLALGPRGREVSRSVVGASLRLRIPRGSVAPPAGSGQPHPTSCENEGSPRVHRGTRARQRQPLRRPDLPFPPPPGWRPAFSLGPPHKLAPQPPLGDWPLQGALAAAATSTCPGFAAPAPETCLGTRRKAVVPGQSRWQESRLTVPPGLLQRATGEAVRRGKQGWLSLQGEAPVGGTGLGAQPEPRVLWDSGVPSSGHQRGQRASSSGTRGFWGPALSGGSRWGRAPAAEEAGSVL